MKHWLGFGLLLMPLMTWAYTPMQMINNLKGIDTDKHFPCKIEEVIYYCWQFKYQDVFYRAVTQLPDIEGQVLYVMTPPSDKYPEGEVPLDVFHEHMERDIREGSI